MKFLFWITGVGLLWATGESQVLAHRSQITVNSLAAVEITALYGASQPMQQAQVVVYPPGDAETPWQTGQTDAQGKYRFIPDQDGLWEIKVRQAGHGVVTHVPVELEPETVAIATEHPQEIEHQHSNPLRQGVMILSVLWGCIGTACFFCRKSN